MSGHSVEYIYGINTVTNLIENHPKRILSIYISTARSDKRINDLIKLVESKGITVEKVSAEKLDDYIEHNQLEGSHQGGNHQGVVAACKASQAMDEAFLDKILKTTSEPLFFLLLDGVTDPHNLGACIRSADAAGVHAVIVPKNNSAGLTPVVRKVASGAAETTPLVMVTNLSRTLKKLQQEGVWIMGAAGEAEQSIFDINLNIPVAIVMGAEGKGLRRLTRENCDELFKIPMPGAVESLNVSVAAGVSLFEVVRQRGLL